MSKKYFEGIRQETEICKKFQKYISQKRDCKSYLAKRKDAQASIDFLGRLYDSENKTIAELAVEVRTIKVTKKIINDNLGYIIFPISKLNELMKFWRIGKEVYIVYSLQGEIYFLNWDYYLKHNFEIGNKNSKNFLKLPIHSFIPC